MVIQTNDNKFSATTWIVDPSAGKGTHTTIQAAINTAQSKDVIVIHPGKYSENITLKAGVSIIGLADNLSFNNEDSSVNLAGSITANYTGQATVERIHISTDTANCFVINGANNTFLKVIRCEAQSSASSLLIANSTGNSIIQIEDSSLRPQNTTAVPFAISGNSQVFVTRSRITPPSVIPIASTISSGSIDISYSECNIPFTTSGTGSITATHSLFSFGSTQFVINGTTASVFFMSQISNTGNTPLLTVGTGATATLRVVNLLGNANPLVSGAGTCTYDLVTSGTGIGTISATTSTGFVQRSGGISFDGGTTYLRNYQEGTWMPVVTFGGTSTGITYGTQSGSYTRIGNIFFYAIDIQLSSKGTATGNMTVSTPTGFNYLNAPEGASVTSWANFSLDSNVISLGGTFLPIDIGIGLYHLYNGGSPQQLDNTNFNNNSRFRIVSHIFLSS